MNTILIVANVLVLLTFIIHTFGGDREYKQIEPRPDSLVKLQEFWTMGRGAFHILSVDFLFASIGLTFINFTNYFNDTKLLLNLFALYFLGYGIAFLVVLLISKKFNNIYLKLWQWLLMFIIAALIYWGNQ